MHINKYYVHMYVYTYACTYVCMYVCTYVCIYVCSMHVCMHVYMLYACMCKSTVPQTLVLPCGITQQVAVCQ